MKIHTGPIEAICLLTEVPRKEWATLIGARRSFIKTEFPYACLKLLEFVRDAEQMYEALGYASADDFIRRGLEIDPSLVTWAAAGLRSLKPQWLPEAFQSSDEGGDHG